MKDKRLIIFDFFGVLGGELSPKWFGRHFDENKAKELKDKYFVPADNGVYTIYETLEHISKDLGFDYDVVINEFRENVKVNEELFNYVLKLRENNTVCLLSNAAIGIFDLFYPNVNVNKYFDKVFISAEHHMQKPEYRFYLKCVNSFDNKFDEIYMIDDNLKNIKDLNNIGIKGIQYFNNEELFKITDEFLND